MILLFLAALILAAAITVFLLQKMSYEKTDYYTQTKNSYISMIKGVWANFIPINI